MHKYVHEWYKLIGKLSNFKFQVKCVTRGKERFENIKTVTGDCKAHHITAVERSSS